MDERKDQIAAAVGGLLEDDEMYLVSQKDGRVHVSEHSGAPTASLAAEDPELYGYLATLTSDLDGVTGCGYMLLWLGIAIGACFAADRFTPEPNDWRAYSAILSVCLYVWNWTDDVLTMRVYRANRDDVRDRLHRAGMSRERAIGLMGDDGEVDTASKYLKKDKGFEFTAIA